MSVSKMKKKLRTANLKTNPPPPQFAFTGPGVRFVLPCSEFEFASLFVVVAVVVIVVVIVVVVVVLVARAHKYKSGSRAG